MLAIELKTDEIVRLYIALRDRRAKRKAAYEAEDAADKAKQERLEALLLRRMQESGEESIRTKYGTAYQTVRSSASVADRDVFLSFVRDNAAWDMIEARANKTAVEQWKDVHGELPPGVNWRSEIAVNFRRS